jgi:hypothetical protein
MIYITLSDIIIFFGFSLGFIIYLIIGPAEYREKKKQAKQNKNSKP